MNETTRKGAAEGTGRAASNTPVLVPVILTIISLSLYLGRDLWLAGLVDDFSDQLRALFLVNKLVITATLLTGCWAVLRLSKRFLFEGRVRSTTHRPVPRLLTDIYALFWWLLTLIALLVIVFEQSLLVVCLMIGGLVLIVLVLFREMLEDLLAGLSVNLDPTLGVGDLIRLSDGLTGRLAEINWRSATLRTPDGAHIVVPNRLMTHSVLVNLSAENAAQVLEVPLIMDFSAHIPRVLRVLEGTLGALQGSGTIVDEPAPVVYANRPVTYGTEFVMRMHFNPEACAEEVVRSRLMTELMSHFRNSGLAPSLPKQNLFLGEARMRNMEWRNPAHRESLIAGFEIFTSLEEEEMAELAASCVIHEFGRNDQIIRQGEEGTSMYVLVEGYLEVTLRTEEGDLIKVGDIVPGQYFGEMSLLVGDPRTATVTAMSDSVVFEITRQSFAHLIDARTAIAEEISRVIAARQLSNTQALESSAEERSAAIDGAAGRLFSKMRSIFSSLGRTD